MCWRLRLSDKTVRRFAELPIYCQPQKCSPGNVVSGGISFMQIFVGVRWRRGVKWEWGSWKLRFSLHSFTFFRTFCIHGHTTAFRWYDCQWPWTYFKVVGLFHIEFLKNGVWYGKSYNRQLIGNHTLAFDWCHFWWLWSTFEGHFMPRRSDTRRVDTNCAFPDPTATRCCSGFIIIMQFSIPVSKTFSLKRHHP